MNYCIVRRALDPRMLGSQRVMDCWIIGLLDYWIVGLLDYWIIGLLDYWIADIF